MRRAAPALLALVVAVALVPSVLQPGEIPFQRDILDFFLPMKAAYARALRAGEIPWWDPWTYGGQPFFATLQSQVLYPPNLVFALAPLGWAYSLFIAAHLAGAGVGAWGLARELGARPWAAVVALAGTEAGGFLVSLSDLTNQLCAQAWTPWILLAACRFASSRSPGALAAWATSCALCFLGGEPQYALLAGLASVALAWARARASRVPRPFWRAIGGGLAAAVLALGATCVQLVPLAELVLRSERAEGPMHAEGKHALEPERLSALVTAPEGPWRGPAGTYVESLHVGWLILLLAVLGAAHGGTVGRTLAAGVLVSLLLAMGPHVPLLGPLQLEALGFVRYPVKNACIAAVFLPLLAALGAEHLAHRLGRRSRRAASWALVALAAATCGATVRAQRGLVPTLPQDELLRPTDAITFLRGHAHPDGPRVHATALTAERLRRRAARVAAGDLRGATRERVELLEGALPMLFEVAATGGASALAPRAAVDLLERARGPLAPAEVVDLRAGWLLDAAPRELPLPRVAVDGGAARLYELDGFDPAPGRRLVGPNVVVGPAGREAPSAWPGWREGPPGTWTFRPTGLVPLGALSLATCLALGALAMSTRRSGPAPRPSERGATGDRP